MTATRSILDGLASGSLPDTRAFTDRAWAWVPSTEPPADGRLTIRQRKTRGRRLHEIDSYLVAEQEPQPGIMGRVFLVAKQNGANAEVYQTIVGPLSFCDCTASRCHVPNCKHRDALAALVAEGVL